MISHCLFFRRSTTLLFALGVFLASSASAAEKSPEGPHGLVETVEGKTATVVFAGPAPAVGDAAEFFFELAGLDDTVSVATGKVIAVEAGGKLKIQIENATGDVAKDQMVKFSSAGRGAVPTTPTATSTVPPGGSILVSAVAIEGDWEKRQTPSFTTFGSDGFIIGEEGGTVFRGKYRVDPSQTPPQIDVFEIEGGERISPDFGGIIRGIYQFEEDGRLKLQSAETGERPKQFGEHPMFFKREGAPGPEGAGSLVGKWKADMPPFEQRYRFTGDGKAFSYSKYGDNDGIHVPYSYDIDGTTSPARIDLKIGSAPEAFDRGIIEILEDGSLKLETTYAKAESERPKEFSSRAGIYERATGFPEPPSPPPDETLVNEAVKLRDGKDFEGALTSLNRAIELNPKNARAFFWRGLCFSQKEDWKAAVADLEQAMKLDPSMDIGDLIEKTKAARDSALSE